jgi:hypothetical protein
MPALSTLYRLPTLYDPWRHAASFPELTIHTHLELPGDLAGLWVGGGEAGEHILLCRTLPQVEQRCTLGHELDHYEEGPAPMQDAHLEQRAEKRVDVRTCRRLIPLEWLLWAVRWAWDSLDELADELWVDLDTLKIRLAHLARHERAAIAAIPIEHTA